MNRTSRNGVEAVCAQCLIKGVTNIDASNVAVAGPPEVVTANAVRLGNSISITTLPIGAGRTRNPFLS